MILRYILSHCLYHVLLSCIHWRNYRTLIGEGGGRGKYSNIQLCPVDFFFEIKIANKKISRTELNIWIFTPPQLAFYFRPWLHEENTNTFSWVTYHNSICTSCQRNRHLYLYEMIHFLEAPLYY